jgi:hypothetical protein
MRALGNKITLHSPSRGFSMELGSAITVLMVTRLKLPVCKYSLEPWSNMLLTEGMATAQVSDFAMELGGPSTGEWWHGSTWVGSSHFL